MAPEIAPAPTSEAARPGLVPENHKTEHQKPNWLKYGTPFLVFLLAGIIVFTITRNWNAWEGDRVEQVTDDANIRGDVTPLSTKVAGIVREVRVSDFQSVRKGDLLVQLADDDYRAQVTQASAAVAAAKAAIENNRRQRRLQESKIERALAGVGQAQAEISAAQAGVAAAQADLNRALPERKRQENLIQSNSTTRQKLEQVVADEERARAHLASREAALAQTKALLSSSQSAVEAERRALDVLNSQEAQLTADLHAKEASLTVAQVNLGYTRIESPEDGIVGERQVRPGQLVSPGTQVISFVSQVKWVQANYRETQLTNMKVGNRAEIRIDVYPGKKFNGRVVEIAPASGSQFALLPPDNATGNYTKVVQRIPVKIMLDDSSTAINLRPGLSATASVRTKD